MQEGPGMNPGPFSHVLPWNRLFPLRRTLARRPAGRPLRGRRSLLLRRLATALLGRRLLRSGLLRRLAAALLRRCCGLLLGGLAALLGRGLLRSPLLGRLLRSRLPLGGRLPLRRR